MPVNYRQNYSQSYTTNSAWLLYIFSLPYVFSVISKLLKGEIFNLVLVSTVAVSIIVASLWMSIGLKNKHLFEARKYPDQTPFPMMFLASLVLGASALVTSWLLLQYNLFAGIGFGIAAMVGCWLWYGLDPIKNKHISFADINDSEKALQILQESETLVINIENATKKIENNEISQRLNTITKRARDVLTLLYENPKKITKARRFLRTYLTGAESVVKRYAKTHKETDDEKLVDNFNEVLVNIEEVFVNQQEKLISSDVFDLDVDIEVLNTLLKKQGIN